MPRKAEVPTDPRTPFHPEGGQSVRQALDKAGRDFPLIPLGAWELLYPSIHYKGFQTDVVTLYPPKKMPSEAAEKGIFCVAGSDLFVFSCFLAESKKSPTNPKAKKTTSFISDGEKEGLFHSTISNQ